jgi:hypothetical protein
MWIVEFRDYKQFLKAVIATYPRHGRGLSSRLAELLNVAPIVITQILKGERHFNPDQTAKVAIYFGFDEKTTEYLLCLVNHDRADSDELRTIYSRRLAKLREEAVRIKNVFKDNHEITDADKSIFYSNWYFSAVRVLSSIKRYQTVDAIAQYLGLPKTQVGEIVAFLVSINLCIQEKGVLNPGPSWTYVGEDSPYLNNHRRNWRLKAIEKFGSSDSKDLFYSSPVSISKKDSEKFRRELLKLIESFASQIKDSPEEKAMCLNIDWFEF